MWLLKKNLNIHMAHTLLVLDSTGLAKSMSKWKAFRGTRKRHLVPSCGMMQKGQLFIREVGISNASPFITEVRDSRKTNLRTSAPPRPQTSQGSVVQEIKVGHTLVTYKEGNSGPESVHFQGQCLSAKLHLYLDPIIKH